MKVPHLTDLLTWDEIWTCKDVYESGQGDGFGPVRLCLPDDVSWGNESANGKPYLVRWFSAKARYAAGLLRRAEETVCAATGAEPERVEWIPASESFNTIRYPNLDRDAYVSAVMRETERLADFGTVSVRTGIRSLGMQKSASGEEKERLEIVLPDFKCNDPPRKRLEDVLNPGIVGEREYTFLWSEISEAFAVLSPMQVAFLHEDQLHRHTALDDELLHACRCADEAAIRSALDRGANIHALDEWGESACACLVGAFEMGHSDSTDDAAHNPVLAERLLRLLLDHGADLDLVGSTGDTALCAAAHCASWMTELLLNFGAGPDVPCRLSIHELLETPIEIIRGEDWAVREYGWKPDDMDMPNIYRTERLLVRAGAGDIVMDRDLPHCLQNIRIPENDAGTACLQGLSEVRQKVVWGARNLSGFDVLVAVRSGARLDGKDAFGRNLLQVAVEDSREVYAWNLKNEAWAYHFDLTNFVLFLLGHMHFPMETEDWRELESLCRKFGLDELLKELAESPLFGERFREAVGETPGGGKA